MVSYQDRTRLQRSWPWWRFILTGLNVLALVLSAMLSWHYLEGGSMIGCSGGSPCDRVLNSQWSMIGGVLPISGLALGAYLALFIASLFIGPTTEESIRHLAWSAMLILVGSVAGSAVWFTILQKWVIKEFCFYCMTTHITAMLLTVIVIWRATKEFDNHTNEIPQTDFSLYQTVLQTPQQRIVKSMRALGLTLIGLVLAGIMAACQVGFNSSAIYSNGESHDNLPVIDYHTVPMIGSSNAPYIVTLLFDYNCPHCQQLHLMLDEAVRRYDDKLAFALCPTPLNTQCNPYIPRDVDEFKNSCELAKIGLAVWVVNRNMFPAFDNWMFTFETGASWRPRSLESARNKAVELVGQEKFNAALNNPWLKQYMQTCIRIYGQTIQSGNGGVPKLIFNSRWVIPEPNNADDLVIDFT